MTREHILGSAELKRIVLDRIRSIVYDKQILESLLEEIIDKKVKNRSLDRFLLNAANYWFIKLDELFQLISRPSSDCGSELKSIAAANRKITKGVRNQLTHWMGKKVSNQLIEEKMSFEHCFRMVDEIVPLIEQYLGSKIIFPEEYSDPSHVGMLLADCLLK